MAGGSVTVAALRHHASVGRLSVEELDARSEQAYGAATLSDLAALQADLPALASRPLRHHHGSPGPGWRSFTSRWHSPVGAELALAELIAHLAPEIQARGFDLIQRADDRLRFERRRRPGWTWAIVVLVESAAFRLRAHTAAASEPVARLRDLLAQEAMHTHPRAAAPSTGRG